MDAPDLDPVCHDGALRGLARLNFWSGSAGILWPKLAELAREAGRLRILDIATGAGDVPLRLWQRARRAGLNFDLEGCDHSTRAVAHATERARKVGAMMKFFIHDALVGALPDGFDVLMCSLFLHHLDTEAAQSLLSRMAFAAKRLVLVNDLARGPGGLLLAHVATRLLTTSKVVHIDGPRSVQAAFTLPEARALAGHAGLTDAIVEYRWPCRWLMTWKRQRHLASGGR